MDKLEFHLLDTGHFALEEDGDVIAEHIRNFLTVKSSKTRSGDGKPEENNKLSAFAVVGTGQVENVH